MSHHDRMKPAKPELRIHQVPQPMTTHHGREVTPGEAAEILRDHTNIRTLNEGRVRAYVSDMLAGNWNEDNPQGLIFDQEGKLINGQHRLTAQVRAGITLAWTVTVHAPPSVVQHVDGPLPRPAAIGLSAIYGGSQAVWGKISAICRLIRFAGKGTFMHMSSAEQKTLAESLEEPGIQAVYTHVGSPRLNTPTRAAFVYAWPCDSEVEKLWAAIVAGYPPEGCSGEYQKTFAVLQGCVSRRLGTAGITQKESFYSHLRCIQAILNGEGLQLAKSFPLSFEKFTEQRKRLGKLPVYPNFSKAVQRVVAR